MSVLGTKSRRIRHDARDGLAVAGLSLGLSAAVALVLGALVRWLG